jgi:hypothetical protein
MCGYENKLEDGIWNNQEILHARLERSIEQCKVLAWMKREQKWF